MTPAATPVRPKWQAPNPDTVVVEDNDRPRRMVVGNGPEVGDDQRSDLARTTAFLAPQQNH